MSYKVVKGFSLQLNLNLKKGEEEPICLNIENNLPQIVVEQKMCSMIGSNVKGKIYLDIFKVCKCQFSQEYLYLVENLAKKSKGDKSMPVTFLNLENEQEKMKFLTQDQLVNNVILTKNSYEQNEDKITIYDFTILEQFLDRISILQGIKLVPFKVNIQQYSSSDIQIISNPLLQFLTSKAAARGQSAKENEQQNIIRTGYLSMDSKQRILPLQAQDEGVYKVPLVGVWIQSDENVNDIFLWTLFIEYAKNGAMKKCNISSNQKSQNSEFSTIPNYSDISFLFVWFQTNDISNPLFFEIQIVQSAVNKCFQKAQLSQASSVIKFDYRYSKFKPVNIIENGLNHTFEAQDITKRRTNSISSHTTNAASIKTHQNIQQILQTSKQNVENKQQDDKQQIYSKHQQINNKKFNEDNTQISNNKKEQINHYKKESNIILQKSSINDKYKNTNEQHCYKNEQDKNKNQIQKKDDLKRSYRSSSLQGGFQDSVYNKNESINLNQSSFQHSQQNFQSKYSSFNTQEHHSKDNEQLKESSKERSLKLSTRDLISSIASKSQIDCKPVKDEPKKEEKSLNISTKVRSYSHVEQNQQKKNDTKAQSKQQNVHEKQSNQSKQSNLQSTQDKHKPEKENQLFYKSTRPESNIPNNFAQFQQNTLKQHQILYEQNTKIDELEKQIQNLKKELQSSKSKDKLSPRVELNNSEYSTVKKRSSKSAYSIGSGNAHGSGCSVTNTNDSKVGTKFVSRTQEIQSPAQNIASNNSLYKVKECGSLNKQESRNLNSATTQAMTTANKSFDSCSRQKQDSSYNINYKSNQYNQSYKYLSSSSTNHDNELTIGQLCSNEKPPLGCLSTARSNQVRSSIKNLSQRLNNIPKTSSSKQVQKQINQQSSSSSTASGGANVKKCRFLENNDELPRIKFDFSNIQDNEESEDDSLDDQQIIKYKLTSQSKLNKQSLNYKMNTLIDL